MQPLALMNERNFHSFLPMPTEKVKLIILERELISYNTGTKNICKDLILKMVKQQMMLQSYES